MSITKTLSGEAQYSEPILIGRDQKLQYEIKESTLPFSAKVSLQWLIGSNDPSRPQDADTAWTTIEEINAGSANIGGAFDGGKAWYRLAILTGDYTSGAAVAKLQAG